MLNVVVLMLIAVVSAPAAPDEWKEARHSSGAFSFQYPAAWELKEHEEGWLSACTKADDGPCFFVSAYQLDGGNLADFAELRLAVEAEKYKPLGKPRDFEGKGWRGLIQEGEGIAMPEETEPTRRVMLCVGKKSLFVSMTLYTSPKDYGDNAALYDQVFRSLRLKP
jgi:hypothetical protein